MISKRTFRSSIVSACALAMVACGGDDVGDGPKVSTKQKAAALILGVGTSTRDGVAGADESGSTSRQLLGAVKQKAQKRQQKEGEFESACPKGGKMKAKDLVALVNGKSYSLDEAAEMDLDDSDAETAGFKFKVAYEQCGLEFDDPETEAVEKDEVILDGDMKMEFTSDMPPEGAKSMAMSFKLEGKLDVSGAFDDRLDTKIVQTLEVSENEQGMDLTITLDGHVKTATEDFKFDKEKIELSSGFGDGTGEELSSAGESGEGSEHQGKGASSPFGF